MKRLSSLILVVFLIPLWILAQSQAETDAIEKIKSQPNKYYWGESTGYNEASVISEAQMLLSRSIKSHIIYNGTSVIENDKEHYSEDLMISSTVRLNDMNKIVYDKKSDDGDRMVVAFVYISRDKFMQEYEAEKKRMNERVFSLIKEGKLQEGKVNIADALRYFNWAINLARFYKIHEALPETDNRPIDTWLDDKIKSLLANIEVVIEENGVKVDERQYDKYSINLRFTYANRPISLVEFRYFTGETNMNVSVKNGEAVVKYPSIDGMSEIKLNILYAYDGENDLDEEMMGVYKSQPRKTYDNVNIKRIPVKIKNNEVKTAKAEVSKEETAMLQEIQAKEVGSVAPTVKDLKKETQREFLDHQNDGAIYISAASAIENAIRTGKYSDVKALFNDDAYTQFLNMTSMGEMSISKQPVFKLERSKQYVRCGRIPVNVKTGKNVRNENIVLRFSPDDHKVTSISYALTENAENDIFRDSQWTLDARYSLLKFMEDYQTAFALKNLQYIEQIFDDNAIIITGNTITKVNNKRYNTESIIQMGPSVLNGVRYSQFDKKSYIKHLSDVFHRNSYVYLTFHDAVISKASTPEGMAEAYWIELKQDHNSTKYNDKGYLTLQIGMQDKGSVIYVRTWTPHFISLDEMKNRYKFADVAQ